ncbi:hypothetical protein ACFQ0M_10915 [Kitasatospora aburaviensis]
MRRDEQGFLSYLGRRDEQFKSRGFRVNPTEIEAGLLASGLLSAAVVFADASGEPDPGIVAAVVPVDPAAFRPDDLAAHVRAHLPGYQQPDRFHVLETLPRTGSGKADRALIKAGYAGGPDAASAGASPKGRRP